MLGYKEISIVSDVKDLGVSLNKKLKLGKQIEKSAKKFLKNFKVSLFNNYHSSLDINKFFCN